MVLLHVFLLKAVLLLEWLGCNRPNTLLLNRMLGQRTARILRDISAAESLCLLTITPIKLPISTDHCSYAFCFPSVYYFTFFLTLSFI